MNRDTEKERPMPPDPDTGSPAEVGAAGPGAAGGPEAGRLGPMDVQAYIGRQLRAVYDDVVKQPVPDRFLDLMKQLEEQDLKS